MFSQYLTERRRRAVHESRCFDNRLVHWCHIYQWKHSQTTWVMFISLNRWWAEPPRDCGGCEPHLVGTAGTKGTRSKIRETVDPRTHRICNIWDYKPGVQRIIIKQHSIMKYEGLMKTFKLFRTTACKWAVLFNI